MKIVIPICFLVLIPFLLLSKSSAFVSDPGTMNLTPLTGCDGEEIMATYNYNASLDPGDVLQFILHDDISQLGTVLAVNDLPIFGFVNGMNYNTNYFISAIAGTDDGSGNVDLNDPDLAISIGTPVQFTEAQMEIVEESICDGGSFIYLGVEYTLPGTYNITVPNQNGCDLLIELILTISPPLDVALNLIWDEVTCFGPGIAESNLIGSNYEYLWEDAFGNILSTDSNAEFYWGGEYYLIVTDLNTGCQGDTSFIINENTVGPFVQLEVSGALDCNNTTVTIFNQFGFGFYSYNWSDPNGNPISGNNSSINVSSPGTYEVFVIDFTNGCIANAAITVVQDNSSVPIDAGDDQVLNCLNGFKTTLQPNFNPGSNVVYSWVDPNGGIINDLSPQVEMAGTYCLQVNYTNNNCSGEDCIEVKEEENIITNNTSANCDVADGTASVIVPGVTNLLYEWSTGETTSSISNLLPGEYYVTITGVDCEITRTIEIEETPVCKVRIKGTVYLDNDVQDCQQDPATQRAEGVMLQLLPNNIFTFTDSDGNYEFLVEPGNFTVQMVSHPNYVLLCPNPNEINVDLPDENTTSNENDFYVRLIVDRDLSISATNSNVRPQFKNWFNIEYCNNSDNVENGTVTFVHDPALQNIVTNSANSVSTYDAAISTATWSFTNLQPQECRNIKFRMDVPVSVLVGQTVTNQVNITPTFNDVYPDNNSFTWSKNATASFDPNDKQEFSGEDSYGGAIYNPEDSTLFYQVRFQNTGTDTAFKVVIKDVLDDNLDVTTIRSGVASHDYELQFEGSNTLIFVFENILLPHESIDTIGSQGFVTFSIKQKANLPLGTEIRNDAGIYFDFNAPIITNEVVNTLESHFYKIEGNIRTENGDEVTDVNVILQGDVTENYTTNMFGSFSFEELPTGGDYQLNFDKNTNPWNGVTTQDIVLIRKHILGIEYLDSPYKLIAADANNSGEITALDMVNIRSLILLNTSTFPNNTSWRFVDGDYVFQNPNDPWVPGLPEIISIENLNSDRHHNIIGIKIGDVNSTANPSNLVDVDTRNKVGDVSLSVDNQLVRVGEEVHINFYPKDFENIQALQFTLEFDKHTLSYSGFTKGGLENLSTQNFGLKFLDNGKITFAWTSINAVKLETSTPLFSLNFKALKNTDLSKVIKINSSKTEAIAYDENENAYDVRLSFEDQIENDFPLKIRPTIVDENVLLKYYLKEVSEVTIEVTDLNGIVLQQYKNGEQAKGIQQRSLDAHQLSAGIYFIIISSKDKREVGKFIKN